LNPTYKFSHISFRTQIALLIYICLITSGPWQGVFAQIGSGIERTDSTAVKPTASHRVPGPGDDVQRDNESREMSVFFTIGIAINAIMMLSFAVWLVSEWKKPNKKKAGVKRE
jgi:hypothetical protein